MTNNRKDWDVASWSDEQKKEFGDLLTELTTAYEENAKLLGKLVSIYEGMANDDQTEDAAEQPEEDQTEDAADDEDDDIYIIAYNGSGKPLGLSDLYTPEETTEAAALYDGSWCKDDAEELVSEYGMSREHADRLCEIMKYYEIWENYEKRHEKR